MRRLFKPLVAVVSGLALLFLSATPSAATSKGTVNSGTLSVNLLPALVVDLDPNAPGDPCPANPPALELFATTSGSSSPYGLTTTLDINFGVFRYNNANYFLDISATATSGTLTNNTPNPDPVSTGPFSTGGATGNIYPATVPPNGCTPATGSPLCAGVGLSATAPVLSLSGDYAAGATGMTDEANGTAEVDGSGRIQASGCGAPFAALNNRTLTITDMNVTFASHP